MRVCYFDTTKYREEAAALEALQCPPGARILGIDVSQPNGAIEALIAAKREGLACCIFPILPDPFEDSLRMIGTSIAATLDPDVQMDQFIALRINQLMVNGKPPSELAKLPNAHLNASALVLRLADLLLLAAPGERDRYSQIHARQFPRAAILPVPAAAERANLNPSGVTIYAPSTPARDLTHFQKLLEQRRLYSHLISLENASELPSTLVVLCPEWRPMRARTLAAAGHHVVAPTSTGVDECDRRIFGYLPVDYRSLLGAIDTALTESPMAQAPTAPSVVTEAIVSTSARYLDGPRVSVIVRTYDRPALLARAVASIASQSYRNVEIVVVNNGGDDVRDIVESASGGRPFRYESMPERKLISGASNVGAKAATGDYIGYLDDDDLLYGDHCARTAQALHQTGVDLVFTLCVGEYAQMDGDRKNVMGYQVYLDRQFQFDDVYVANMSPIHSIVHQRSIFDRIGYFDEALPVTDDWELWLRLASAGGTFLRIDRATCEYSWRFDPLRGNMTVEHQWDFVRAFEVITTRYAADVANRTSIRASQANAYAAQVQRAEDTSDPATRAQTVISSQSATVVPVAPDWERGDKPT